MSSFPTRSTLAGSPSRATLQSFLLSWFDATAQRLANTTTGVGTPSGADLTLARESLGLGAGADIASAATLDLSDGPRGRRVTGTTTTTAFTLDRSGHYLLTANGAWPINVSGVLVYTCAAGDSVLLWEDDDGVQHASIVNPIATATSRGPVKLATTAIAQAGLNSEDVLTPATMKAAQIQLKTKVDAAGQTSIQFTDIPAWVNEITFMPKSFRTSGTSLQEVRLGTSVGVVATGYDSQCYGGGLSGSNIAGTNSTSGFLISRSGNSAWVWKGGLTIRRFSGNIWVASGNINSTGYSGSIVGEIDLGAALTTLTWTTQGGTDTATHGSLNVSMK